MFKLGSLFDGAGTFPLAGKLCGVKPVWASEIEPFPVSVTEKRLPNMKHLGDITKVNGADIEPVDIITFGSPCQDLSVAGKRAGLDGERSGLFMEAVRIIKEMRGATNERYPQIAMWENVPGAFSSNKGEDFRVVLEELCKICDSTISIPRPTNKRGKPVKWEHEGCIVADGFSIAWRLLDAQFWGVPQRRKRIFLVADFGGQCAGEILFECGGLSRNFTQSREKEQGLRPVAENGFGKANRERERERVVSLENHPADSRVEVIEDGKAQTLTSRMGTGGGNVPLVLTYRKTGHAHSADEGQGWEKTDIADTLNVSDNTEARTPVLIVEQKQRERERESSRVHTESRWDLDPKTHACTERSLPQYATARTPDTIKESSSSNEGRDSVIGADMYNSILTGDVSMTVCAAGSDCHKVPCVITMKARERK